jgi:hypothetical protein
METIAHTDYPTRFWPIDNHRYSPYIKPNHTPKYDDLDNIHFLIAAQKTCTGTEAARCAPKRAQTHNVFTRLLQRQPPDSAVNNTP